VAVRGTAANDANFNQGSDEITYRFNIDVSGDLTVSVSLNYQTIGYGYLQDLYSDANLEQVQTFKTMYDAQSLKYEQITSAQTTVVSDGGGAPPVPTATLTAAPGIITEGEATLIEWSSTNANSCTVSGGNWSDNGTSGSVARSPTATTTYTLNCDGGSASDSVTVTVNAAPPPLPTATLTATPSTINDGESTLIEWSSTNTTSCTVSGGGIDGSSGTSGSAPDNPGITTTYTLNCDGGSASDSVTVTVNAQPTAAQPTVNLTASPSRIARGSTITLSWSSTDATSCTASGGWSGSQATSGSMSLSLSVPATFTLNCSGDGGSASNSVSYAARGRRWLELR
jgi:hypothetical protein